MAIAYRDTEYYIPADLKNSLDDFGMLIRNIANNINQIAHSTNIFRDVDANRVFQHLADLDKQVQDFIHHKIR